MNSEEYIQDSLHEIALSIKSGSRDVFQTVYRSEYNNLLFFVKSYTKNTQDAEDLVQESMMSIWVNRENLDENKNFRSYMYTIARNKTLNYLRDNAKRLKDGSLQESENLINTIALNSASVEEEIEAMELQGFVDRILLSLPDKVVHTFKLSRQEGMTYNEIAEELGVTTKVVEYHIHLTLKALRLRLGIETID